MDKVKEHIIDSIEFLCSGEALWDSNLTWNTATPDLTSCFQKTILPWVPCLFLLILSPLRLFLLPKELSKQPHSGLSSAKNILCYVLMFLSFLECLETVYVNSLSDAWGTPAFFSSLLTGITMIIANYIMITERQRKIRSSGFLLGYWFLMSVSLILMLQSHIRRLFKQEITNVDNRLCLLSLQSLLSIGQLVLTGLFVDKFSDDNEKYQQKRCAEKSTILSILTFSWVTGLIREAYRRTLKAEDMVELPTEMKSETAVPIFEKAWHDEVQNLKSKHERNKNKSEEKTGEASLVKVLFKVHSYEIIFNFLQRIFRHVLQFSGPLLFKYIIDFAEDRNDFLWHGILFAFIKFSVDVVQLLMANYDDNICHMLGIKIRTSVCGALYRKMTKLSYESKENSTVGEMVNLMADDAMKITDALFGLHFLWIGPFQSCVALYFLYQELKSAALVGFSLLLIFIPMNVFIAKKHHKINKEGKGIEDERMNVLNEVFNGIKVLKLYAWELSFEDKIGSIRSQELRGKMKRKYFDIFSFCLWGISEFLITFVMFAMYLWSDENNSMTTKTIFYTISLLGILQGPILHMPNAITSLVETSVALKRIQKFLNNDEIDEMAIQHNEKAEKAIVMNNASFAWNKYKNPILKNIDMDIPDGGLVAVVGAVGAGKSSLLAAAVGEMEKISGDVCVKASMAYVTQQAWIQNNSLKENVLFGKEMCEQNYSKVLDTCALRPDLDILPGGDETEIGEKGINLSGGQKQRVSLARAVYQNADIYLLDDPLSAVDAHVGRYIFENVIGKSGLLRNKTRVLVTHAISFLPNMDKIISMVDGEISEVGTYTELMENNGGFAKFIRNNLLEESSSDEESTEERHKSPVRQLSAISNSKVEGNAKAENKCKDSKFIEEEAVETGHVKWSVYTTYLKAAGPILLLSCFFCFAELTISHYNQYRLSEWNNDNTDNCTSSNVSTSLQHSRERHRLTVYGSVGLIRTLFDLTIQFLTAYIAITSARKLHQNALSSVMRAPLNFFDTTPIGRIINRFSKDMGMLDGQLPWITQSFMQCFPHLIFTVGIITLGTPNILFFVIPLCIVYFFVQRIFTATATQTKRIFSALRSPQYSHFSESIHGVTTIRAFNKTSEFAMESDRRREAYIKAEVTNTMCYRWLGIRLEFLGNILVFIACILASCRRDVLSSGIIALVMTYSGRITGILNWIVHVFTEMDTSIVSVERIQEYINIKPEAAWRIKETKPAPEWPHEGHIKFSNFSLRYREGLDLVLKGIDCEIFSGEKIGIVGRTGAGKSSLTLGLFRILEKAEGSITIDDIDISTIGLHDLRSKLTVIPQDPILFSGTIRMNLDPFNSHTDKELWEVLELAHLKKYVDSLEYGLQHECTEGGENLSVGQRQLVCLARALLRKTKVLVLDEATAAIDLETDKLIQNTIRREFADCTILTIAHRLNTIMDYSRILVLDKGEIKEFATPDELLKDEESIFYKMAKDANLV
ncbi:multidrug resistance-associated protein 1-like [Ostrea edulis]|uniref:multidrug resistance-associated protein 1-like n=1 Tax=Ostrea edulis TaxID=37623 RepID=UPI0024AFD008|nr:multidrug resistance-associated protein 1-like [Ostrea edulis]